jgi:hypothetical protein
MSWWNIYDNDWGIETMEWLIAKLQWLSDGLTWQLGNYSSDTLEWSQSIDAITGRVSNYKKAIDQYTDLINNIKWSADEAKRWSVQKQQANQWYVTWLSTKRGNTYAEGMKDIADAEGTGVAERASIRGQEMSNLWEAAGWLSNLHMKIAEQQAVIDEAAANSSWSSGSGTGSSSLLDQLEEQMKEDWMTDAEIEAALREQLWDEEYEKRFWKSNDEVEWLIPWWDWKITLTKDTESKWAWVPYKANWFKNLTTWNIFKKYNE